VIFKYFKVYTINGLVICVTLSISFLSRSIRYFGFASFSFFSSLYRCKLLTLCNSQSTFSTCIDICILLERISYFQVKYRWFLTIFKEKPYLISLICLTFSIFINTPIFLAFEIRSESEFRGAILNNVKDKTFTYCQRSSFSITPIGRVLTFLVSFIRDVLFLVIEIVFTIISLYYLTKFFNKKSYLNSNNTQSKTTVTGQQNIVSKTINTENGLSSSNIQNESDFNLSNYKAKQSVNYQTKKTTSHSKNRKLQIMSLSFAVASICLNLSSFAHLLVFIFDTFGFSFVISGFNVVFVGIVKYFLSFFLFYFFNKSFRNYVVNLFKKNK